MHKNENLEHSSNVFKKLLEEKKVSAYRVSKETGIDISTLSNWRNEHYEPKFDKMRKIADFFGVPVTDFYK